MSIYIHVYLALLHNISSICIKGARTKSSIFFSNCVLKKQEEKENEMKKNKKCVLTLYQFKDINMVCTLTPYQDMLVFSALKT